MAFRELILACRIFRLVILQVAHKPTIVVYSYERETNACSVIRILDPMLARDWNVIWASKRDGSGISFDLDVAYQADVIIIHRMFPSKFTEKILRVIVMLGIPVVYDLDDLFLNVSPSHRPTYQKFAPYIKWILKEADIVIVSTPQLKKTLSKYTARPIHVKQNIIDFNLFTFPPKLRTNQFNFLVSGTPSHQRDWAIIEEPIEEILKIYGEKIKFMYFGDTPKKFIDHPSVNIINYQPNYKLYAEQLKELNVHAALIPLIDTNYNQCKSNIKWLEYSAAGIPGAYSDITPYNSCISHEKNGLLVKNDSTSWFNAMNQLIVDTEKTANLIKNAQREVRAQYSIESSLTEYTATVNSLFGKEHKNNTFSELPILHYRLRDIIIDLLNRHITWRFKK